MIRFGKRTGQSSTAPALAPIKNNLNKAQYYDPKQCRPSTRIRKYGHA